MRYEVAYADVIAVNCIDICDKRNAKALRHEEAMPFSSGDSHMKFGDTSCFLKKLLVYLPRPECLA